MGTKNTRFQHGQRRGVEITGAAIDALRSARVSLGLSQRAVARQLGCSQSQFSRFEAKKVKHPTIVRLASIASILGLEPSLTFHAKGPAIRDKGHEALIGRLLKVLSPTWHVLREAPFPNLGDARSWDVLLRLGNYRIGIEAETRIRDVQALVRRMRDRAHAGGADVILIVLSDSAHNRQLVDQLRAALGEDFSTPQSALLQAIRNGTQLRASGVVLL